MKIDFAKNGGLAPAIIQDARTNKILMLGYMNEEAFAKTKAESKVTFYSRSKGRLWTKGETSGHYLLLKDIRVDCDNDTILIKCTPTGPVCHTGSDTCFNEINNNIAPPLVGDKADVQSPVFSGKKLPFITHLQQIIHDCKIKPTEDSYTSSLFRKGTNKIAQKVGEEAVEVVIEAIAGNDTRLKEEAADLFYHLLVLLEMKKIRLDEVVKVLESRHKEKSHS